MNCAKHPDALAIGICCNCGRALCTECNPSGISAKLACSTECKKEIANRDAALSAILSKTNRSNKTVGIFSLVLGLGSLVLGLYHLLFDPIPVMIGIGFTVAVVFCTAGVIFIKVGKKS